MTGFATSVIGCKVEAGIEAELAPDETPDGRPGVSVLLFGFDAAGLGQPAGRTESARPCSPVRPPPVSTACRRRPSASIVGGHLRHFGDRFQSSKFLDGQRYWRIPVMEGEFLVQEAFGVQKAIGGGNFLILARDQDAALAAAEAAVDVDAQGPRRHSAFPRRDRARRQQGGREALQEDDRVHQRRVLSDAARTRRRRRASCPRT